MSGSILITRAPSSVNNALAMGVAIQLASSRTVTPWSSDAPAAAGAVGAAALSVAGLADRVNSGPSWRVRPNVGSSTSTRVAGVQQLGMQQGVARPRERLGGDIGVGVEDRPPLVPGPFAHPIDQDRAQGPRVRRIRDVRRGAERFLLDHVLELERRRKARKSRGEFWLNCSQTPSRVRATV